MSRAMVHNTIAEGDASKEGWHFFCSLTNGQRISLPYIRLTETYVAVDWNNGSGKPCPMRIDIGAITWCTVDHNCIAVWP